MNKRGLHALILTGLTALSALTIFGTGYALWDFGEEGNISNHAVYVDVTESTYLENFHVHTPNIFILEGDNSDIATYGGLAFYTDRSSEDFEDHFHGEIFFDDMEKQFSSIAVGFSGWNGPTGVGGNEVPPQSFFEVKVEIRLSGFIQNYIAFTLNEGEEDNDTYFDFSLQTDEKYLTIYPFFEFREHEVDTNNDGVNDDIVYESTPFSLDGRFIYNSNFDKDFRNGDKDNPIDVTALYNTLNSEPYNGELGAVHLSFILTPFF